MFDRHREVIVFFKCFRYAAAMTMMRLCLKTGEGDAAMPVRSSWQPKIKHYQ
jgi:hypothetical protein